MPDARGAFKGISLGGFAAEGWERVFGSATTTASMAAMTDREVIEWVASARIGDALPNGITQVGLMEILARQGFYIALGTTLADAAPRATAWAREWLAASGS